MNELQNHGFSRLNVMHLFRACAFIAIPDGRKRTPLHKLTRTELKSAWTATRTATKEAISIVRNEFGLVNMDILWSGALLVPLIALCHLSKPRDRDPRGIAGWIAMAALRHRYSKASETALDQDLRACRAEDPIGNLLSNIRRDKGGFGAIESDFGGKLNDRGALFASYVACRHKGMRDLFTGSRIMLQSNVDRHHLLPRAQFSERIRSDADIVANVAFITGSANRAIGAASPDVYLKEIKRDVLDSQCIPLDNKIWRIDRAPEFWAARRQLLASAFNSYLRDVLPGRHVAKT